MTTEAALDISQNSTPIFSGHLHLGGSNSRGRNIEFTNYYMLQNGKPCIPVMGEFHFSRCSQQFWEEELLKMKAGGIDIVATYVFWIHIEEEEGVFNWSGNRDLRQFIQLCAKHQLDALVRIGPFAHGECRNGGLPDWMYGRPFQVRSNDERYLAYVRRLYTEIASQLEGLLFKDNGPVIGIQLDNEYMHCGAPWEVTFKPGTEWVPSGSEGVDYIIRLKQIAQEVGLDVPIYTCTGWLNSPIIEAEILPMQGGYAFTPWSPDPNYRQAPTREFIFRNRHLDPVLNGEPTYDASRYPYACCEIGGGIQITYYHRPIVPPESVEALALMNLAGGANLIGYYMYHGGSNPVGKHSYMNEFTVPRISYDFQAPLGEYGQTPNSYHSLRLLHLFLRDFGDVLAPMGVILPEDAGNITPQDTTALRWMVRAKEGAGFVFLNNYQDHVEMRDIADIRLHLQRADRTITIPHNGGFTLQKAVCAILPFGLSLDGVHLEYATAQLLTKLEQENLYVFFAPRGMTSQYAFDPAAYQSITTSNDKIAETDGRTIVSVQPGTDSVITLIADDKTVRILTLTREQAERCTKQRLWGQERLLITSATCVNDEQNCWLYTRENEFELSMYPPVEGTLAAPFGEFTVSKEDFFTHYTATIPQKEISLQVEMAGGGKALIKFSPDTFEGVHNVFLQVDYVGDQGNAFIDGKLVADNFYNDTLWEIGLQQVAPSLPEMLIAITPIMPGEGGARYIPTGMAFRVDSDNGQIGIIHGVKAVPEYKIAIRPL